MTVIVTDDPQRWILELTALKAQQDERAAVLAKADELLNDAFDLLAETHGEAHAHYLLVHKLLPQLDHYAVSGTRRKARVSGTLRRLILERDAYRCLQCGSWQDLCVDHVVAESRGGPTIAENLQTLCRSCNLQKGAR